MPILPVTHQSWLFAPPLDMPLQVRLENGRFDSLRPGGSPPRLHAARATSSQRAVIDRQNGPPSDGDMAPIDPTRELYPWEQRLVPDEPLAGGQVPLTVGVKRIFSVPFFRASFESEVTLHVPWTSR
jgi:hypothetical protein